MSTGTKDFKGLERDVERAKQLVAEAGYPNGVDITMRIIGASNYTKPAEVVQAQLKEIGINLSIEPMERASWLIFAIPVVIMRFLFMQMQFRFLMQILEHIRSCTAVS